MHSKHLDTSSWSKAIPIINAFSFVKTFEMWISLWSDRTNTFFIPFFLVTLSNFSICHLYWVLILQLTIILEGDYSIWIIRMRFWREGGRESYLYSFFIWYLPLKAPHTQEGIFHSFHSQWCYILSVQ